MTTYTFEDQLQRVFQQAFLDGMVRVEWIGDTPHDDPLRALLDMLSDPPVIQCERGVE